MRLNESRCRTCGADIVWAKTPEGRWMPLDSIPALGGNVVVGDVDGTPTIEIVASDPKVRHYISHFVTCPHAARHRRAR